MGKNGEKWEKMNNKKKPIQYPGMQLIIFLRYARFEKVIFLSFILKRREGKKYFKINEFRIKIKTIFVPKKPTHRKRTMTAPASIVLTSSNNP